MDARTFNAIVERRFEACGEMLGMKGADYTDGKDRLYNFKSVGGLCNTPALMVWLIYFLKHIYAIISFCVKGKVESEPIQGRITDAINYLVLLEGLVEEQTPPPQEAEDVLAAEYQKALPYLAAYDSRLAERRAA